MLAAAYESDGHQELARLCIDGVHELARLGAEELDLPLAAACGYAGSVGREARLESRA